MTQILATYRRLRRPRILIRAARMGVIDYRRQAHLPRILGYGHVPKSADALRRLLRLEQDLNVERRAGGSSYSIARHVDLLIAMMGEARLMRASRAEAADEPMPVRSE